MKIAVLKETRANEWRVAATPDAAKRFIAAGASVTMQAGAGENAGFLDAAYAAVGAEIAREAAACVAGAEVLLVAQPPGEGTLEALPHGICLVGALAPHANPDLGLYAAKDIRAFALELLPRISRAQGMDILSSQSNLAGYRAVIEAFAQSLKVAPMMMTAAGTVPPARLLVLGAGVAGLQAIATAKRMGAVVSAFDVRAAAREQVESLGAKFIEVKSEESGDAAGGYAKEMSEDYKRRQSLLVAEALRTQDMVVTTALIPGKPAPVLIAADMVAAMKPGAVIVDMAAAAGGNCALTRPGEIVREHGVAIVGHTHLAALCAPDASALYARNLFNFVSTLLMKDGKLDVRWDDELVQATLLKGA